MSKKAKRSKDETEFTRLIMKKLGNPGDFLENIQFEAGDFLEFRRSRTYGFYVVYSGHVALERHKEAKTSVIRICGPGDMVGFGSWAQHPVSSNYHLRALEAGGCNFMPYPRYLEARARIPEFNDLITSALIGIIIVKDERIAALESLSVRSRVAQLLLSLADKFGKASEGGYLIDLKVDRLTLAALAGTSPESLARVLTDLEEEKLIARRRRQLVLLQPKQLEKMM